MEKSKRLISILLSMVILFFLSACKETKGNSNNTTQETTSPTTQKTAEESVNWYSSENNGVVFSVRTSKESYSVGEFIKVFYKVENNRESDIFQKLGFIDDFYVKINIRNEYCLFQDLRIHDTQVSVPVLKRKKSFKSEEILFSPRYFSKLKEYDSSDKSYPKTGKYTVIAETEYADSSKFNAEKGIYEESYKKVLETQKVEFEITLTDAQTTTTE